jgi:hypothetical protein
MKGSSEPYQAFIFFLWLGIERYMVNQLLDEEDAKKLTCRFHFLHHFRPRCVSTFSYWLFPKSIPY